MAKIEVELEEFTKGKEGSILIKKNGKWGFTTFDELNKENADKLKKFDGLKGDFDALARNNKHFVTYAKSHFMVVFNAFKIKVLSGDLDVEDEEVLKLDEAVLNMISNAAMFKAKDSGTVSYLSGDNAAAKVFNQVNQYKLDKKYISQKQFEENNTAFLCSVSGIPQPRQALHTFCFPYR